MVGSSARSYGVDRFYNPPAVRRQLEQQRKQRELLKHPSSAPPTKPAPAQKSRPSSQPLPEDRRIELEASSFKASASCSSAAASVAEVPAGNLDRFLESITPIVPALYFPKMSVRGWRSDSMEPQKPYFSLGDLWESFKEWSAYGAGVPLVLNESDWVLQYYVPYLSAIQLFVDPNMSSLRLRRPGDESDGDPYLDTSSEGTSESGEADMLTRDRPFMGSTSCVRQKASVSEYGEFLSSSILPEFEYLESDLPHFREPLANKISTLASKFHDLKSYKSCDLLPSSWMSVAWYPIYRIPIGSTLQDLDACFLTFHFLSAPSKGKNLISVCPFLPNAVCFFFVNNQEHIEAWQT
ncbi:hypothetical protein AXF42_Ash001721 [Apostasia shenzhenica]|uniref:DUF789 domain-containing protein n=1 Tax=Apostasia shenzhenica TaxID=1088818 RepID=A0A2I0AB21_9ASPA|nr:hypothetical protein AXF42_Ash001721 [Apostasia shenzhenica]